MLCCVCVRGGELFVVVVCFMYVYVVCCLLLVWFKLLVMYDVV